MSGLTSSISFRLNSRSRTYFPHIQAYNADMKTYKIQKFEENLRLEPGALEDAVSNKTDKDKWFAIKRKARKLGQARRMYVSTPFAHCAYCSCPTL